MTAIRSMLIQRSPMLVNEFRAAACSLIPAEATRYGRVSRLSVVRVWERTYASKLRYDGDYIAYAIADREPQQSSNKRGPSMLAALMISGSITQEQSGFKRQTWNSYSRALRRLKWVVRGKSGELVWCGPSDAQWVAVTRENSGDKRQAAAQEATE